MDRTAFKKLQEEMPWTDIWAEDFLRDPRPYSKFLHCLTNIAAKLGAIFQRVEMTDHYGPENKLSIDQQRDGTALAIIVMSAMKAATVHPHGPIDLSFFIDEDLKRRKQQIKGENNNE